MLEKSPLLQSQRPAQLNHSSSDNHLVPLLVEQQVAASNMNAALFELEAENSSVHATFNVITAAQHKETPQEVSLSRARSQIAAWRVWYYLRCLTAHIGQAVCRSRRSQPRTVTFVEGCVVVEPLTLTANAIHNRRFSFFSFFPLVLFEQFSLFQNAFYLVVCLSQLIPSLQIGPLFASLTPLAFVISVTLAREAYDDIKRFFRDREINFEMFDVVDLLGTRSTGRLVTCGRRAQDLRVGDIMILPTGSRVPADSVLLKTHLHANSAGEITESGSVTQGGLCFIKTDQLDGETDWKLRRAVAATQRLSDENIVYQKTFTVYAETPRATIHGFEGSFTMFGAVTEGRRDGVVEGLTLENTLWSGAVIAGGGPLLVLVVYTGEETRQRLNSTPRKMKLGLFDLEVNFVSKVLFGVLLVLALTLTVAKGITSRSSIQFMRFLLLLSSILPLSLRVNLDMAKLLYSYFIYHDQEIPGTVVRSSTLSEELGQTHYLLTDKTGTLTCNEMTFKRMHTGRQRIDAAKTPADSTNLRNAARGACAELTEEHFSGRNRPDASPSASVWLTSEAECLRRALLALMLCHTLVPATEDASSPLTEPQRALQGASPDEVALVTFGESLGLRLVRRTDDEVIVAVPGVSNQSQERSFAFKILLCIPHSSERKRMSIVLRLKGAADSTVHLFVKGADSVMLPRLRSRGSHWVSEEVDGTAREGLRTLVFANRTLSAAEWTQWEEKYQMAMASVGDRQRRIDSLIDGILETDLSICAVTGVEDRLQRDVRVVLEAMRQADVRVWMLTGDKVETATCIALSSGLARPSRHRMVTLRAEHGRSRLEILSTLSRLEREGLFEMVLILDGQFVSRALEECPTEFVMTACRAIGVVCCRCSPTDKARVAKAIGRVLGVRTCAIGDGGNDVPMITAADVGVGIVGKEGKQASLAADFSVQEFRALHQLMMWHGRLALLRSGKLSHFVIHRGLLIAVIQIIFSTIFFFTPLPIFPGWLTVGYATFYTMAPVFSLTLDTDVPVEIVQQFPELYSATRAKGGMTARSFFVWLLKSIYQGTVIMLGTMLLFERDFLNVVAISFTALVLSELLNVASEIMSWHRYMLYAQVCTVLVYFLSLRFLPQYFDPSFTSTLEFWIKVSVITAASWVPVHVMKTMRRLLHPPQSEKLLRSVRVQHNY